MKVDLISQEFVVFFSNLGCCADKAMSTHLEPFRKMIPQILHESRYFEEIFNHLNSLWPFRRPRGHPQNVIMCVLNAHDSL